MPRKKTTKEFIKDAKVIHGDKYDYSLVKYKHSKSKVIIICKKHGIFEQNPNNHLNGQNCPKCDGNIANKKTIQKFKQSAIKKHGDKYDYTSSIYRNNYTKINIICKKHGSFEQIPYHHLNGHGCPKCSCNKRKTTKSFISESIKIHGNKYTYDLVKYLNMVTKIEILCKKHGVFKQFPYAHLNGNGCPSCYGGVKKKSESFIKECEKVHNYKYDYSHVNYINSYTPVDIKCEKHGIFKQRPGNHLHKKYGCPECSKTSRGEIEIKNILMFNGIVYKREKKFESCFYKQNLKFDFYLPNYNLCIEYDGIQHFEPIEYFGGETTFKLQIEKDLIKNKYCKDNNIKLIRIPYWDFGNIEKIIKRELCL